MSKFLITTLYSVGFVFNLLFAVEYFGSPLGVGGAVAAGLILACLFDDVQP